jgi:hypothetical protein
MLVEHVRCRERARGADPLLPDGQEGTSSALVRTRERGLSEERQEVRGPES